MYFYDQHFGLQLNDFTRNDELNARFINDDALMTFSLEDWWINVRCCKYDDEIDSSEILKRNIEIAYWFLCKKAEKNTVDHLDGSLFAIFSISVGKMSVILGDARVWIGVPLAMDVE